MDNYARTRASLAAYLILVAFTIFAFARQEQIIAANKENSFAARRALVTSGNIVSVDGCNRDFKSRVEIRKVLQASKTFQKGALKRGDITRAQYVTTRAFYDQRLKELPLPDCRKSANILTASPDKKLSLPKPLYP